MSCVAREWGLESQVVETAPGRANVLVRADAGGPRSLGLCGHLDTKPVGDAGSQWRTLPFELIVDGDAVLVGEPSGVEEPWEAVHVVSCGICCFEVLVSGRQGHSGLSDRLPTSATVAAAEAVLSLRRLEPRYTRDLPGAAAPTVNPGMRISGGVHFGVHPGQAAVACEVRLVPGMRRDELAEDIRQALAADARRRGLGDPVPGRPAGLASRGGRRSGTRARPDRAACCTAGTRAAAASRMLPGQH